MDDSIYLYKEQCSFKMKAYEMFVIIKTQFNRRIVVFALKRHRVHVYEFVPNDKIHRNDDYVEGVPVPGNENHCNISFLILLHSKPCNPLMIIVTSF